MLIGDVAGARTEFEAAQELHAREGLRLPPSQFVQDPGVEVASALAPGLLARGRAAARTRVGQHATARAASNRHALSETTALSAQAIVHALAREFDAVYEITERLYAVIRESRAADRPQRLRLAARPGPRGARAGGRRAARDARGRTQRRATRNALRAVRLSPSPCAGLPGGGSGRRGARVRRRRHRAGAAARRSPGAARLAGAAGGTAGLGR